MYRTDADGNVGGLFTDGDPAVPTPATVLDSAFLNEVQEELCSLIEAAGIALVKGDRTQLDQAVRNPVAKVTIDMTGKPYVAGSGDVAALEVQGGENNGAISAHSSSVNPTARFSTDSLSGASASAVSASSSGPAPAIRTSVSGAGPEITFTGRSTAPTALEEGSVWFDSVANAFKCYVGGTVKTFTLT